MANTPVVRQLHDDLSSDLAQIARRFKAPRITLIVRNPQLADGDVVIGNDDLDEAIAAIRRMQEREPVK